MEKEQSNRRKFISLYKNEAARKDNKLKRESDGQIHIHAYREKDKLILKITGIRVTSEITDLNDAATEQTGTRVTTIIYLKGNPVQ